MVANVNDLTIFDIGLNTRSATSTVNFCWRLGLLRKRVSCRLCRRPMKFYIDRDCWRCHRCKHCASDHKGTFFANTNLSKATVVRLMYLWSRQYCRQVDFMHELHLESSRTVVDWKNFMRDVCAEHFNRNPFVIGGVGHTVEIDECMLVRRKYHRGHRVRHQWVFGAVDIDTTEGLMIPVDSRDAATLLPIIQRHILPGTI